MVKPIGYLPTLKRRARLPIVLAKACGGRELSTVQRWLGGRGRSVNIVLDVVVETLCIAMKCSCVEMMDTLNKYFRLREVLFLNKT